MLQLQTLVDWQWHKFVIFRKLFITPLCISSRVTLEVPGVQKKLHTFAVHNFCCKHSLYHFFRMEVLLEMESISRTGEEPPDSQNEEEHSDEACQFMAEPPGGSQSGHQRKSGFMKKYRRSVQRSGNPSLTRQSSVKGKARQSFESCTSYCQRGGDHQ